MKRSASFVPWKREAGPHRKKTVCYAPSGRGARDLRAEVSQQLARYFLGKRGGVSRKGREASSLTPPGWCSFCGRSERHPGLAKSVAARHFLDRSSTPPR